jgi:hypothetical protein
MGEKWPVILPTNGEFQAIEGIFYMPQICGMGPKEGMLRIFFSP